MHLPVLVEVEHRKQAPEVRLGEASQGEEVDGSKVRRSTALNQRCAVHGVHRGQPATGQVVLLPQVASGRQLGIGQRHTVPRLLLLLFLRPLSSRFGPVVSLLLLLQLGALPPLAVPPQRSQDEGKL